MSFFHKIPRAKTYLRSSELVAVFLKILFGNLKKGQKTELWERMFADYFGSKTALALPRARLALFYLLKNLDLPAGSEVILTPLTIADMVNAVLWAGHKPVFCDLGQNTYNIDCDKLRALINPKTKAIFVTHLNGLASDMDQISKIANEHSLVLIEDASQALGAEFNGKKLGTFGLAGIFSLSFLKTCSTLFGGMIISDDVTLIDKIRLQTQSFPPPPKMMLLKEAIRNIVVNFASSRVIFSFFTYYFVRFFAGLTSKFIKSNPPAQLTDEPPKKILHSYTDIQAQMGMRLLENVGQQDEKRIKNVETLASNLSSNAKRRLPKTLPQTKNVFWRLPFQAESPQDLQKYLLKNLIDSAPTNLVLATALKVFENYVTESTPQAESAHKTIFIPIHSDFSQKDMLHMAGVLNKYCG